MSGRDVSSVKHYSVVTFLKLIRKFYIFNFFINCEGKIGKREFLNMFYFKNQAESMQDKLG